MKVESITAKAISQGLTAGRTRLGIWKSVCAMLAIAGGGRRHTPTQR